jgi:hypothetical protein
VTKVSDMAVQQQATEPVDGSALSGLEALLSLAVTVLNGHTADAGLCVVRGSAWPRKRVVLAEHSGG